VVAAGHPVLRSVAQRCDREEIDSDEFQTLVKDMAGVMRDKDGVGLAAPQLGLGVQLIVMEDRTATVDKMDDWERKRQGREAFDMVVLVNPELELIGDDTACFFESCLSIPGYAGLVERHLKVRVTALDQFGEEFIWEVEGWPARILQHEYDHLQGILYTDRMERASFRSTENSSMPLPDGLVEGFVKPAPDDSLSDMTDESSAEAEASAGPAKAEPAAGSAEVEAAAGSAEAESTTEAGAPAPEVPTRRVVTHIDPGVRRGYGWLGE
jgi:peptide deformylase